jgi:hypothetical protein
MTNTTMLARQAFEQGRWRAIWRGLRPRDTRLPVFAAAHPTAGRSERGLQTIRIDQIAGSVNANRSFDDRFNPRTAASEERWVRLYRGLLHGDPIPPIRVYQIGTAYYVEDGHHRVSVARAVGQMMIEAEVIEIRAAQPPRCPAVENTPTRPLPGAGVQPVAPVLCDRWPSSPSSL